MRRETSRPGDLPLAVRRFVERRIDNIEQLEILLLLQQQPDRWTGADAVGDAVRLTRRMAAEQLEALGRRDLLDVRIGADVRYRYNPATPELVAVVRRVADAYRDQRAALLALLVERRLRALRDFSDAFRVREDDDG